MYMYIYVYMYGRPQCKVKNKASNNVIFQLICCF